MICLRVYGPPRLAPYQRLQGVGWADSPLPCCWISKCHTMVNVFVGWSTALDSRQSILSLRWETCNKVDYEFFVGTTELIKIKWFTYSKVEILVRPILEVSTRKIIHHTSHKHPHHDEAICLSSSMVSMDEHTPPPGASLEGDGQGCRWRD